MTPDAPAEMKARLAAAVRKSGLKGLSAAEIERRFGLGADDGQALSQELESEGEVLILSFSPLRLLSRSSLDHLKDKIRSALERHHRSRPSDQGPPEDKLRKRFEAPRLVFTLALKALTKEGLVAEEDGRLHLASFSPILTPRDEQLLARLEEECSKDGFGSDNLEDFRAAHRLAPGALDRMLSILVGRQKIVRGRDGLYLHARWLEEVVAKVRLLPGGELSVTEFKAMTGLSRKYAIPLLELLDQMGVTRRKGSTREVLPPKA